uniref:DNA polymerase III subunit beta n=1 Tax=Thermofilum pendens TaxID=2269 RepID=A0A7C3WJM6_THEPE
MSARERDLGSLKLPPYVKEALEKLAARAREELGDVEIYLFGSYARGDWLLDSDVDLVVVSPKFEGLSMGERYALVRRMLPAQISAEVLAYTPEEFARAKRRSVILRDASKYWVRVA